MYSIIHSLIHSFSKCLLSTRCVPGTGSGAGDTAGATVKVPAAECLRASEGRQLINHNKPVGQYDSRW